MALIDEIKKRLSTQPEPTATGSQQAQTIAAFQAKTGKAMGSGAPKASAVGENIATGNVDAQNRQLNVKAAGAAAGLGIGQQALADNAAVNQRKLEAQRDEAGADLAASRAEGVANRAAVAQEAGARLATREAVSVNEINAKAEQAIAKLSTDRGVAEADIFAEFKASNNELAWRRDQAELEQAAQQLALRDKEYVDDLLRTGTERRLESELGFSTEMNEMVLGAGLQEHLKQIGFQVDLNADKRTFDEQMGQIDLDTALAIMFQGNQDASMTAMLGNINNAGEGIAKNWPTGKPDPKPTAARSDPVSTTAPTTGTESVGPSTSTVRGGE